MTKEQPQLFTIPATTLTRIVNFLGDLPFKHVAPIMVMIDNTVKPQEQSSGTVQRSQRKRNRSRPEQ
jgi:hypothetical protein